MLLYSLYNIGYTLSRNIRFGIIGSNLRRFFLLKLGADISESAFIGANTTIVSPNNLRIGNNVSIHENCYIDASGKILIGDNVSIAHGTSLISFNHTYKDKTTPIKEQPLEFKKIIINDNCWIGCKCVILPGVTINSNSIVAAGAIVTKTYPDSVIIGGNPAKIIKTI